MTTADGQHASPDELLCPLLGVARDANSRFDTPTPDHACYAGRPRPIALEHQAAYCLSGAYEACPRFIKATGLAPVAASVEVRAGSVSLSTLTAALLALALVGLVAALAVASGLIGLPSSGGQLAVARSPTPSPAPTEPTSPSPPPVVTPSPRPSPPPTQTATASPLPTPTSSATPAPTPRTHVVSAGESLTSIGRLYGLPWQLIAQANGLSDRSVIYVGQELVIPQLGDDGAGRIHYVEPGETLNEIAALYGVSPAELAEANGLEDLDTIYAGQPLIIPEP